MGDGRFAGAERYVPMLRRYFADRVRRRDVDGLVQDAFLHMAKTVERYDPSPSFRLALLVAAREMLLEYEQRRASDSDELDDYLDSDPELPARSAEQVRLIDALRGLVPDEQLILELRYWAELDDGELAEALGITEYAARARLARARSRLRAAAGFAEGDGDGEAPDDADRSTRSTGSSGSGTNDA